MDREEARRRQDAYLKGESVRARDTATVTRRRTGLGIVPIGSSEDFCMQALAFGRLDSKPTVHFFPELYQSHQLDYDRLIIQLLNLLAQANGQIWLPDQDARLVLALEAERIRDNPARSPHAEEFARVCDVLFDQSHSLEQQVVVVATEILGGHLTPGQSPTEDGHLGVRLAWDNPVPHVNPRIVAEERRKQRSPTWLPFADDEKIEAIRERGFNGTATPEDLLKAEKILNKAVSASWQLLRDAHRTYLQLPVQDLPGLEDVAAQSWKDFTTRVLTSLSACAPATSSPEAD